MRFTTTGEAHVHYLVNLRFTTGVGVVKPSFTSRINLRFTTQLVCGEAEVHHFERQGEGVVVGLSGAGPGGAAAAR